MNFPSSYLHCSCLPLPGTVIRLNELKWMIKVSFNGAAYPQIDHSGGVVDHFAFTVAESVRSRRRIDTLISHLTKEYGPVDHHVEELSS